MGMKKAASIVLASALAVSLAACGSTKSDSGNGKDNAGGKQVEISFGLYTDPARDKVAAEQARLFMAKHPDIKVNVVSVPYSNYYTQLGSGISSGDAWDVFMINGAYFSEVAPKGALMDLTGPLKEAGIDMTKYVADPTVSTYNGKTYALPYELNMSAIFYNKDMFDAAKVPYPQAGWTWDDLLSKAKALTKTEGGNTQWGFYSHPGVPLINSFITQNGGSILNADRTKSTFNTPEVKGAVQFMADMVLKEKVSPGPKDLAANVSPFMTGKIAMVGGLSFDVLPNMSAKFKWGIAPWPVGKKAGADYWTQGIAVANKTKHAKEALAFAQFLISAEAQTVMAKERGATPSLKEVAESQDYVAAPPEGIDVFIKQYTSGQGVVEPFNAKWAKIVGAATSAIQSELSHVWLGETSVDDAVAKADKAVTQILNDN